MGPLVPDKSRNLPLVIQGRSINSAGKLPRSPSAPNGGNSSEGIGWKWRHAQQVNEYKWRQEKNKRRSEREKERLCYLQDAATRNVCRSFSASSLPKSR